ncbi:MAG: RnfABCDGE type electron transport complex subunit G [Clostridia bacterium]|nr:RnfABCDGE type electron transport complex subunit G [Clostridia bacterium]MBR3869278.1 RnfABCDGE type electron transport complex subunit G [Clostridia bacterium]
MKKFSPKEILIPTIVLLVICVVSAALLGGTNMLTKDKIASIEAEAKATAMQTVMPDAVSFSDAVIADEGLEYSEALDADSNTLGYAFTVSENGYGGEIKVMVGIKPDGAVSKVAILSADNETPGLGQNVKKDSFLDQFIDKIGALTVTKNAPSSDTEIQAVTSATISSSAVTRAVNAALAYYAENLTGGGTNG